MKLSSYPEVAANDKRMGSALKWLVEELTGLVTSIH